MRCIFCKNQSDASTGREHILPESLGNTTQILPPGVVCDKCNNYFSLKVEKPFLDHPSIVALRCGEGLENKRGRIPPVKGLLLPSFPITVYREAKDGKCITHVDVPEEAYKLVAEGKLTQLVIPIGGDPPRGKVLSRFLAKVAFESMAKRLLHDGQLLESFIDDSQIDDLRAHARRGAFEQWPVSVRRIYPSDRCATDGVSSGFQTVHESDFLVTAHHEMYFVVAIFGVEMTINVAGPCIEGYERWLKENDNVSPLYHGKNASVGPWTVNPPDA